MADCPGVLHLAAMADGGLARLRTPGGALTAAQARAIGAAAERLGSGVVDLTNRANLQIRGLAADAGPALAEALEAAGFRFGPAERRRNILVDPFSGLDSSERRDMRGLAENLDAALMAAPWIESLSPKFCFVLDGGGATGIGATPSDVAASDHVGAVVVSAGGRAVAAATEAVALAAMIVIARAAAAAGPDIRARDLAAKEIDAALASVDGTRRVDAPRLPTAVRPTLGIACARANRVALCFPVPVGRLDRAMLDFLADAAERDGEGRLVLAPWSAVVLPDIERARAEAILARSEAAGFTPLAVAERLTVVACAGAPACARASEPAKALGREILALAASAPERLPEQPARLHLSACPKGCAGSAPADLLLLGDTGAPGWSLHRNAAPRAPGASLCRLDRPSAADVLARLRADFPPLAKGSNHVRGRLP